MGYKREAKAYRLQFADADMAGFEATVKGLSSDDFLKLTGAAAALAGLDTSNVAGIGGAAGDMRVMFEMVGSNLLSWNLEDDDGPVPATTAGVLGQDFDFVLKVAMAWMDAIAAVPPPLPASSNGTARLQEASIPMDVLSPSRSS